MKKKPPGVKTPPALKKKLEDFIPIHERPAFAQQIAALQEWQDAEEAMDQSGSHVTPSEVGSSGRSMHSETRSEAQAAMEQAAIEHMAFDQESETPSEQNKREALEAGYISSPDTIQGSKDGNGEEDESSGEEDSNEEDEEESETSQMAEAKSVKLSGGGPDGRGVDG